MLAFAMCGETAHPFHARMLGYVKPRLAAVPEGHASPIYHLQCGALAAYEAGLGADWMAIYRYELLMARLADGAFFPRPSQESRKIAAATESGIGDSSYGPSWTTGTYVLMGCLGRGKLALYGKRPAR
jgi:hypothetical protein